MGSWLLFYIKHGTSESEPSARVSSVSSPRSRHVRTEIRLLLSKAATPTHSGRAELSRCAGFLTCGTLSLAELNDFYDYKKAKRRWGAVLRWGSDVIGVRPNTMQHRLSQQTDYRLMNELRYYDALNKNIFKNHFLVLLSIILRD